MPPPAVAGMPRLLLQQGHQRAVDSTVFTRDGKFVLTRAFNTVKVWNAASGMPLGILDDAVAISRDGMQVLSMRKSAGARVRDVATGRVLATLEHTSKAKDFAFSPDGKRVVGTGDDATRIWDARTGRLEHKLPGFAQIAFSADGKWLATVGESGSAKLWGVASGRLLHTLAGRSPVSSVAFSPDGKRVLTGARGKAAKVWNRSTGKLQQTLGESDGPMAFSRDGRRVLTVRYGGSPALWDVSTGKRVYSLKSGADSPDNADGIVSRVVFSPDRRHLVLCGNQCTLRDVSAGRRERTFSWPLLYYEPGVASGSEQASSVAFSPDGTRLVVGLDSGAVMGWDVATGRLAFAAGEKIHPSVAFSRDGKLAYMTVPPAPGMPNGSSELRNVSTGRLLQTLADGPMVDNVDMPDDKRLVSTSGVWDMVSGRRLVELAGGDPAAVSPNGQEVVYNSSGAVLGADMTSTRGAMGPGDGQADAGSAGTIGLGDLGTLGAGGGKTGPGDAGAGPGDGGAPITASVVSGPQAVNVWNVAAGKLQATLRGDRPDRCQFPAISPGGKYLVMACPAGKHETGKHRVRIWDLRTGAVVRTLAASADLAKFSPDGTRILTQNDDGTAGLWNASNGRLLYTLHSTARIRSAVFSPDGKRVVTLERGTLGVWNVSAGVREHTLEDDATHVAFSPDGKILLTSAHTRARLWDTGTWKQLALVQSPSVGTADFVPGSVGKVIVTDGDGLTFYRLDASNHVSASITYWSFPTKSGKPAMLVTTPDGLFSGDDAAFGRIFYRIGSNILHDDIVPAARLSHYFHRPSLVQDFWAGRPLKLPPDVAKGVGKPPITRVAPDAGRPDL